MAKDRKANDCKARSSGREASYVGMRRALLFADDLTVFVNGSLWPLARWSIPAMRYTDFCTTYGGLMDGVMELRGEFIPRWCLLPGEVIGVRLQCGGVPLACFTVIVDSPDPDGNMSYLSTGAQFVWEANVRGR